MEESSRLPRPLTAQLKVADQVLFRDITFAFWKQLGKGSLQCVAGLGQGRWQVTFSSLTFLEKANEEGLKINNAVHRLEPLEDASRWITIRGAPFEMSRAVIAAALEPYGQLLYHEYEVPKETAPVTTGVRRVRIRMKKPVPNFIRVGSYSLMCTYQGVTRLCRRCLEEGHMATECKASFCKTCKSWGHGHLDCPASRGDEPKAAEEMEAAESQPAADVIPASVVFRPSTSALENTEPQPRSVSAPQKSVQPTEDQSERATYSSSPEKRRNKKKRPKTNATQEVGEQPVPPSLTSQELFPPISMIHPSVWLNECERDQLEESEEDQHSCQLSETDSSFASVCMSPIRRDRSPVRDDKEAPIGKLVPLGQSGSPKTKRKHRVRDEHKVRAESGSELEELFSV